MSNTVERLCEHFREELAAAAHAFYLWKGINNVAAEDKAIFRGINENQGRTTMINFDKIRSSHSVSSRRFVKR